MAPPSAQVLSDPSRPTLELQVPGRLSHYLRHYQARAGRGAALPGARACRWEGESDARSQTLSVALLDHMAACARLHALIIIIILTSLFAIVGYGD